ncbi:MAG TPA: 16S rRNA (guanine(527)-N(7))-methyltransferase RsmG [Methylibium sp.]|uniref:16S rRNA (guanine(527)-N(7))-methyltransferase RsmG n=1 Tax=Methylibium sp. TaxID=2067992 RepID=UPI002DB99D61|nr:16S rRNA (guanine(527)-N(7))-methyltransferase RsmG [Methylibium sp.]HEU4459487.1 16S rRNA (guanine(527)-N(7))-methyltransferase RsmG [Methylibium sp.]
MTDDEALAELRDGAAALDVSLQPAQLEQLLAYLKLIERWSAVYNLTAVRDRPGVVRQHLLDSLAIVAPLRRQATAPQILDVGSGAGLPGLVVAIAEPHWPVTCIDAVGKKVGFMRQVIVELGLKSAAALHGRVETVSRSSWTVVVSRAFASLEDFTRLSASALAPGGCWAAMKARGIADEAAQLSSAVVFHVEPLTVPGLNAERSLVWMRPREKATTKDPARSAS